MAGRPRFSFTIAATAGRARPGTIAMRRGDIRTPAFMPVGTAHGQCDERRVQSSGADSCRNTYHLSSACADDRRLGGLHASWAGAAILTDSGCTSRAVHSAR